MTFSRPQPKGFTLVELMIGIAIIAVVASIGVPAALRARDRSRTTHLVNELRATAEAFQMYAQEKATFPPTAATFSQIPTGMASYMPKKSTWTSSTPGGGIWYYWNFNPSGLWGSLCFIGVYNPNFTAEALQQIDSALDDGDGNAGNVRTFGTWVLYGIN